VYLADTGGPARLAQVALQPVAVKSDDRPFSERQKDPVFTLYPTGLDGSYRIPRVAPGTYYVVVKQLGYLSPYTQFSNAELAHPTAAVQQRIDALLPVVTVVPNNTATMDLTLTRGASFSGTVRFDDGTPYAGARVAVLEKNEKGTWQAVYLMERGDTNDRGQFRITGLLAGDYLLRVPLEVDDMYASSLLGHGSSGNYTHYSLDFYNGDTARLRDAKPIHLDSSQEMSSADITIPISKLHSVSGAIVEAATGHAINSGIVQLYYADDDKDEVASTKVESGEPVFRFPFVPEGEYVIKVMAVAEVSREEISNGQGAMPPFRTKETWLRTYLPAQQALTVTGDVSGLNLAVSPREKTP
jgi:hypothetical protein